MAGAQQYKDQEILFVLRAIIHHLSYGWIMDMFERRFGRRLTENQVRYIKNKYGRDPRFGTPLANTRGFAASTQNGNGHVWPQDDSVLGIDFGAFEQKAGHIPQPDLLVTDPSVTAARSRVQRPAATATSSKTTSTMAGQKRPHAEEDQVDEPIESSANKRPRPGVASSSSSSSSASPFSASSFYPLNINTRTYRTYPFAFNEPTTPAVTAGPVPWCDASAGTSFVPQDHSWNTSLVRQRQAQTRQQVAEYHASMIASRRHLPQPRLPGSDARQMQLPMTGAYWPYTPQHPATVSATSSPSTPQLPSNNGQPLITTEQLPNTRSELLDMYTQLLLTRGQPADNKGQPVIPHNQPQNRNGPLLLPDGSWPYARQHQAAPPATTSSWSSSSSSSQLLTTNEQLAEPEGSCGPQHRATPAAMSSSTPIQQPETDDEQPKPNDQQQKTNGQQPSIDGQLLNTDGRQPVISGQPLITEDQLLGLGMQPNAPQQGHAQQDTDQACSSTLSCTDPFFGCEEADLPTDWSLGDL